MLTIENITKAYKKDVGSLWRVGRVDSTNTSYLFTLINPVGQRIQVNLERNPIGVQYELWCWDSYQNNTPLPTAVPRRRMLDRSKLITPDVLLEQIKQLVITTPNIPPKLPNLVLLNISIMQNLRVFLIRFGAKNRFWVTTPLNQNITRN